MTHLAQLEPRELGASRPGKLGLCGREILPLLSCSLEFFPGQTQQPAAVLAKTLTELNSALRSTGPSLVHLLVYFKNDLNRLLGVSWSGSDEADLSLAVPNPPSSLGSQQDSSREGRLSTTSLIFLNEGVTVNTGETVAS